MVLIIFVSNLGIGAVVASCLGLLAGFLNSLLNAAEPSSFSRQKDLPVEVLFDSAPEASGAEVGKLLGAEEFSAAKGGPRGSLVGRQEEGPHHRAPRRRGRVVIGLRGGVVMLVAG